MNIFKKYLANNLAIAYKNKNYIDFIKLYKRITKLDNNFYYRLFDMKEDEISILLNIDVKFVINNIDNFMCKYNRLIITSALKYNKIKYNYLLSNTSLTINDFYQILLELDDKEYFDENISLIQIKDVTEDSSYISLKYYFDNIVYFDSWENKTLFIYNKLLHNRQFLEWFILPEDIIKIENFENLNKCSLYCDAYNEKHIIQFLKSLTHQSLYNKYLLKKIKKIDMDNIQIYGIVMDILNCTPTECLATILVKTDLTIKEKQEILLLKTRKSCSI